jgi:hypothetical protein
MLELVIACRTRGDSEFSEQLPEMVERYREMGVLVRAYPDCDHQPSPHLSLTWVMWRPPDRAVSSDVRLL